MLARVTLAATVAALALAEPASAATVSLSVFQTHEPGAKGAPLTTYHRFSLTAQPGEANRISIEQLEPGLKVRVVAVSIVGRATFRLAPGERSSHVRLRLTEAFRERLARRGAFQVLLKVATRRSEPPSKRWRDVRVKLVAASSRR